MKKGIVLGLSLVLVFMCSGVFALDLSINSDVYDYDLFVESGSPVVAIDIVLTIASGVQVASTSLTHGAIYGSSDLPVGSTVTIINDGNIYGLNGVGGKGGRGGASYHSARKAGNGEDGGDGGNAIDLVADTQIINNGRIWSGGGGGGGGGAVGGGSSGSYRAGPGGSGGAGSVAGSGGDGGSCIIHQEENGNVGEAVSYGVGLGGVAVNTDICGDKARPSGIGGGVSPGEFGEQGEDKSPMNYYGSFGGKGGAPGYSISSRGFSLDIDFSSDIKGPMDYSCAGYSYALDGVDKAKRLYRFWNPSSGNSHFYTYSKWEAVSLMTASYPDFIYEGVVGFVYNDAENGRVPLYRFWNVPTARHIYTINESERVELLDAGWTFERIEGYVHLCSIAGDTVPFDHYYQTATLDNFYVTNAIEKNKIDTTPFAPWNQYEYKGADGYLGDYGRSDESQIIVSLNASSGALASLWNYSVVQTTVAGDCYGTVVACDGASELVCIGNSDCTWEPSYDVLSYPMYRIYYDEIFGTFYDGANPHDCTSTNKVVGLSANGNVLASEPSLVSTVNACYGDLVCEADSSAGGDCMNGGEVVLRLASPGPAFSADAGSFGGYPVKICCTSASAVGPGPGPSVCGDGVVSGGEVCDVGLDGVSGGGDDVLISSSCVTEGFSSGTLNCAAGCAAHDTTSCVGAGTVVAEWRDSDGNPISNANIGDTVKMVLTNAGGVYDFDIYEEDTWPNPDDYIGTIAGEIIGGDLVAKWTITGENLSKTMDYDNFVFIVNGEVSGELAISTSYSDSPMVVEIISPSCADYFDQGTISIINVTAKDSDDVIDGTLKIGSDEYPFTNGEMSFNYTFNEAGNLQIIANSINSRGVRQRDISNVMIVDTMVEDVYVAACITKPEDFSNMDSGTIKFEAHTTRGINFTLPSNYDVIGKDNLNFYWIFSDGRTNPNVDGANSLAYNFYSTYTSAGNNWATLDVEVKGYV